MATLSKIKASDNVTYNIRDDYSTWGGRNFVLQSKDIPTGFPTNNNANWVRSTEDGVTVISCSSSTASWIEHYQLCSVGPKTDSWTNKQIILSCEVRSAALTSDQGKFCLTFGLFGSDNATSLGSRIVETNQTNLSDTSTLHYTPVNNVWNKIWMLVTVPDTSSWTTVTTYTYYWYGFQFKHIKEASSGTPFYMRYPKIEIGTKPTDWSPALEDIAKDIGNETIELFNL